MGATDKPQAIRLSRGKKLVYGLTVVLIILLSAACADEIGLRLKGHRGWDPRQREMAQSVEPGGSLYQPDADLGYKLLPGGPYTVQQKAFAWHARHVEPAN